jgi:hypothetical protein
MTKRNQKTIRQGDAFLMDELILAIRKMSNRDFWDYAAIIAPIALSVVAIIISLWSGVWSDKIKKLDAFLAWDGLSERHHIIINNSCKRSLVISTVSVYAYDRKKKEVYELGVRKNVWTAAKEKAYIRPGEAFSFSPVYGSVYDVFAYKGHTFDVTEQMRGLPVYLKVSDLDGKTWRIKTNFSLGQIDDDVDSGSKR